EPARLGEAHGDVAAAEEAVAHDQPAGDEDRHRRHEPDPRRPLGDVHLRLARRLPPLLLVMVVLAHACSPAVIHISRGSKRRTASMSSVMMTKSGVAPGPATMSSRPGNFTIGAAIAAMNGMITGHRTRRGRVR